MSVLYLDLFAQNKELVEQSCPEGFKLLTNPNACAHPSMMYTCDGESWYKVPFTWLSIKVKKLKHIIGLAEELP